MIKHGIGLHIVEQNATECKEHHFVTAAVILRRNSMDRS